MKHTDSVVSERRSPAAAQQPSHNPTATAAFGTVPAKLVPPMDRAGLVRRGRLLEAFAAVADHIPLILVVAPPGYGKTTALSQWAAVDHRRFGWVRLDDADNDPVRLLRHVALALHQVQPVDGAVWRALASPGVSALDVVVPRLVASTAARTAPWVLVLDDLHVLRGSLGLDVISALAEALPPGCHLVVASRNQPGLKLSRLRSQGRCVEFGAADLILDADEASAVLGAADVRLPPDAVDRLVRRTEGWPAGIYLAAQSIRGSADAVSAANQIAGGNAFIVDYFRDEVLVRESMETVRFLLRTSPLDQMSGSLCDAALERTGSAGWLAEIVGRNLFVVPQDHEGRWYRYHRLFAEMLRSELRRREPGEEARIHQRAAIWLDEHGLAEQAVGHALAGGDTLTAARMVTGHAQEFVNSGRISTVRGWLEALDDGALESYPPLAVEAGWTWALSGDAAKAQRCLLAAERGHGSSWSGSTPVAAGIARLRTALSPLGIERMLVDAQHAVQLEAPGGRWYILATMLLGVAQLLNGYPDVAAKTLTLAARLGPERPSAASFALAQLSLLAAERNDWSAAETYAAESWKLIQEADLPEYLSSITTYAARAKLAIHRGDVQAGRHHVGAAGRLYAVPSPVAFPWLAAQSAIILGRIFLDLDDQPAARVKAAEARRYLAQLLTEGVLSEQYRQLAADLVRHGGQPLAPSAMTLTAAELRVLQLLPTHLTLREIADELYISRNTVKTQVAAVYRKLRSSTRTEAVREGRHLGLLK